MEGGFIKIPTGILCSPASSCNAQADYEVIFDSVGAMHNGEYLVVDASQCIFLTREILFVLYSAQDLPILRVRS